MESLPEGRLSCSLCHHRCILAEGARGICRVRGNSGGKPDLPFYGLVSSLALDPIEKKPLLHFLPGTEVFSAGFYGCNLRCPFCQNWEISQGTEAGGSRLKPSALVDLALASGAPSLAFTYSEPTVHFEYLVEAADLAREKGLRTVLVTNGQLNHEPAERLLTRMDAVNLDIKCFSEEAYRRVLKGELHQALDFATLAWQTSWLEVTTLLVPGLDEWEGAVEGIAGFLAGLSPLLPLHLSAYHPAYRMEEPPTRAALVHELAARARKSLAFVYEGNLAGEDSRSNCQACGSLLVSRRGYRVEAGGLAPGVPGSLPMSPRSAASCASCGEPAPFVHPLRGDPPIRSRAKS